MARILIAALALVGSTAAAPVPAPAAPALAGSYWEIETLDGKPLEPGSEGERPALAFADRSYSAYAGCNAMGGLYAQRARRLYTLVGPQTQMGCEGARGRQERLVSLIVQQAPTIAGNAERITLRSGVRSLGLRRKAAPRPLTDAPEAWQGTALAGKTFEMPWIDGDPLNRTPFPRLSFAARTATVAGLCGKTQTIRYRQGRGTVTFENGPAACLGGQTLATVSGPNGELLLAGDDRWLGGNNVRRNRPK